MLHDEKHRESQESAASDDPVDLSRYTILDHRDSDKHLRSLQTFLDTTKVRDRSNARIESSDQTSYKKDVWRWCSIEEVADTDSKDSKDSSLNTPNITQSRDSLAATHTSLTSPSLNVSRQSIAHGPATVQRAVQGRFDADCHLPIRHDSSELEAGYILEGGSFICLGIKKGGVEPKCVGTYIDNRVIELANKIVKEKAIAEKQTEFKKLNPKNSSGFADYITQPENDELRFSLVKELVRNKKIKKWMIKQWYDKTVSPPKERLAQTSTVKRACWPALWACCYHASRRALADPSRENINAVQECVATNVASVHGMRTQAQALMFGEYENHTLQIVTTSQIENITTFEGYLKGSVDKYIAEPERDKRGKPALDEKTNQVKFKKTSAPDSKKEYYLSHSTKDYLVDLGHNLPIILAQNDADGIGSTGQNKSFRKEYFFGSSLCKNKP